MRIMRIYQNNHDVQDKERRECVKREREILNKF